MQMRTTTMQQDDKISFLLPSAQIRLLGKMTSSRERMVAIAVLSDLTSIYAVHSTSYAVLSTLYAVLLSHAVLLRCF